MCTDDELQQLHVEVLLNPLKRNDRQGSSNVFYVCEKVEERTRIRDLDELAEDLNRFGFCL